MISARGRALQSEGGNVAAKTEEAAEDDNGCREEEEEEKRRTGKPSTQNFPFVSKALRLHCNLDFLIKKPRNGAKSFQIVG